VLICIFGTQTHKHGMFSLLKKEITSFLGSITGYLVIIVFLTLIALFMWIFPGELNVLDSGYAQLDTLFNIAPWVFMFLIPAITMRSFADENKSGTIELLLTKPLTDMQIILAKYLAGFILVLFSLLPTLIYYYSVYQLGNPPGNLDVGGFWGSFIGLMFLSAGFVSIGIFSSALTDNQIISFILAVFISVIFFIGFDSLAALSFLSSFDYLILKLGINEHYISMSRGVIDTRDVVYFLSLILFFMMLTKTKLESRKW
jgi:ABC-2 type transport system permease protein